MLLFHTFNINTTRADDSHFAHAKRIPVSFNEQESFFNQLFFRFHLQSVQFWPVVLIGFNQVIQNVLGNFCARDRFR